MARVLVIGGTGLLGASSALALASSHEVTIASRCAPKIPVLQGFSHVLLDLDALTPAGARDALSGFDVVVLASGPDDRTPYPSPAAGYLADHLVAPTALLADAAVAAGVRAVVVLGSFFTAWEREHPDLGLAARHPYVAARVGQSRALAARSEALAGVVVEVPYVFGSGLGRYPTWVDVILENAVGPVPFVVYPSGSAPATTVDQVGSAVAGAVRRALGRGPGFEAFVVGERAVTWSEMFRELGVGMGRTLRLVPVPGVVAQLPARRLARRADGYLGIDPARIIPDAVARDMVLDLGPGRAALGYPSVDLAAAIRETGRVRASLIARRG